MKHGKSYNWSKVLTYFNGIKRLDYDFGCVKKLHLVQLCFIKKNQIYKNRRNIYWKSINVTLGKHVLSFPQQIVFVIVENSKLESFSDL